MCVARKWFYGMTCVCLIAALGESSPCLGQDYPLDKITFEVLPELPTPETHVSMRVDTHMWLDIMAGYETEWYLTENEFFVRVDATPPPESEIVLPAFRLVQPVMDVGSLEIGTYSIHAEFYLNDLSPVAIGDGSFTVYAIPEPQTAVLMLVGFALIGPFIRRRS